MAPTLQSGKQYSDELEMEHDIRNLKETITALRDALEKQRAGTATEVSLAVAESQAQIRDLQGTISEMRTEIERRKAAGEEAVQKITAQSAEESRQMQAGGAGFAGSDGKGKSKTR